METWLAEAARIAVIQQFYARQARLIDTGRAAEWAATFTEDGAFHSPTYGAPVTGRAALQAFAERFTASAADAGEVHRHVVTNVEVAETGSAAARAEAYLQIVATGPGGAVRTLRFTTFADRLEWADGAWRVARRDVHRDDQQLPAAS
ncbi:nuclear transport factor 2 family protein [Nocardiopsis coralliicola]